MSSQPAPGSQTDEGPTRTDLNKLWEDALKRYRQETKKDLFDHSIAKDLPALPGDLDQVIALFEYHKGLFKTFRDSGGRARKLLKLIVSAVLPFLDAGAEAASVRVSIAYAGIDVLCDWLAGYGARREGYILCGGGAFKGMVLSLIAVSAWSE